MNLGHLTDNVLLADTKTLVQKERENTTDVLYHLKEIESRRLFSDLGYSSLFEYVVKELGYSEGSGMRRIHSARLLVEMPELKQKIVDGVLSLSNLSSAAILFKKEKITILKKRREILQVIEKKTSRECEKLLNEFYSIPYEKLVNLNFKVSDATFSMFNELKGYLAPKILSDDDILILLVTRTIESMKESKFKLTAPPAPEAHSRTRYIPAIIKKEVHVRDEGKCKNCGSKYRLEYDHTIPYSRGGATNKENLRLLCFSCNQRARIRQRL